MPRIDFNSKIMDSGTSFKDSLNEVVDPKPALILNDSHAFCTPYGMLHSYSKRENFPVVLFFFLREFSAFGLFYRLRNNNSIRLYP
jgi:hypothetical protein